MLSKEDKAKMESHIDSVIREIEKMVDNLPEYFRGRRKIDEVITLTVNKITPESKMILSGVCNQLTKATLSQEKYSDAKIRAEFHKLDISGSIGQHFNFEVPEKIDYEEIDLQIKKLISAGVIVISASGVVSICFKNWKPIAITSAVVAIAAVIVAVGMHFYKKAKRKDADILIAQYLKSVKESLVLWVSSVEEYYDSSVKEFEGKVFANE